MTNLYRLVLQKILRISKRLREDSRVVRLTQNWRGLLSAKIFKSELGEIRLRNGVVLTAPPQTDLGFLFQEIWIDKTYNPKDYRIAPGDVIVDIGANIGVFSLYAATAAPRTEVYAFEPFPDNIRYLRQNIAASHIKNIRIEEKAVARNAQPRRLEITESGITHKLREKENSAEGFLVECTTLDEILDKMEKCDLLKIDCEGSEYEIIYSCRPENLKKIHRIVGEYHDRDEASQNGTALKEFLETKSFRTDYFTAFNDRVGLICATRTDWNTET